MKNKIPTAEAFFKQRYNGDIIEFAKEFAKLHVKAALEAASQKAETFGVSGSNGVTYWSKVNKESILNAYPENLIK